MHKVWRVAPILITTAIFIHGIGECGSARAESKHHSRKSAVGAAQTSHWDHNGSLVSLISEGAKQKLIYDTPRIGLLDAGVKPGTLLFEGQKTGQNFDGTAYQFYRTCKARGFPVTGSASDDRRQITLKGKAPLLDMNCNATGSRDDTLIFTASPIAPSEPPKNTPVAAATGATPSAPATGFPSEANKVEASKSTVASSAVSVTGTVAPSEPPKDNSKDKQVAANPPPESKPAPPAEPAKSETAKDAKPPVAAQTAANTPAATNTAAPPSAPAKENQSVAAPVANAGASKSDSPHPPGNPAERVNAPPPSETPKSTQVAAIPEAIGGTAKTDDASKSKNAATAAVVVPPNIPANTSKPDASKSDSAKTPVLVENKAAPTGPPEKMMEIVLKNGRILRIGRDIDPEILMRIISQLER